MARSLRAIMRAGGTFKAMGALMALLSVFAVCVFAGAEMALANTNRATDYLADTSTADAYETILGTTDENGKEVNSTRYAGRVWTDKSVTADNTVSFTGTGDSGADEKTFTFNKQNGDFLVTYSAMATSQQITKLPKIPVDVVFVLDFSASMTWATNGVVVGETDGSDSRIKAMVDALNETIHALSEDNPQNRIAIVTFNRVGHTMLNLTSLEESNLTNVRDKDNDGIPEYVSMERFWLTFNSAYIEEVLPSEMQGWYESGDEVPDEWAVGGYDNGHASIACNINGGNTLDTDSKTNIQSGLFKGMSILADANDTTFDSTEYDGMYTRIPNVVLMSDGAPTTISLGEDGGRSGIGSWWQSLEEQEGESAGWGDNYEAQSANGFMAMLTAEYMKNKIASNYQSNAENADALNIDELETSMYTIGFSITNQNKSMVALANLVLNPSDNWDENKIHNWSQGNEPPTVDGNPAPDDERGLGKVVDIIDEWENYVGGSGANLGYTPGGRNDRNHPVDITVNHPDWGEAGQLDDLATTPPSYVDEYYPADSSEQLQEAFQQITSAITDSPRVPTAVSGGNLAADGYITYTDPIGKYMEVKGISGLLFGNTQFYVQGTVLGQDKEGNQTIRYYLDSNGEDEGGETTVDSGLYSNQSIDNIEIIVTTANDGQQTLTVRIPASLIPLHINYVTVLHDNRTVDSNTDNNVYPLRLVYEVGVADGVVDEASGDLKVGSGTYSNGVFDGVSPEDAPNGAITLYSNKYSGKKQGEGEDASTVGDATVSFRPAADNPFYFIQEETPIYTSENGNRAKNFSQNETYWFPVTYYEGTGEDGVKTIWISRSGSLLDSWVDNDEEGLYIKPGSPRLGNLLDVVDSVTTDYENLTNTADHPYYPTFSGDPKTGEFIVYLGNNGSLTLNSAPDVLPALRVTKKDADDESKPLKDAGFALYVDNNNSGKFDEGDGPVVADEEDPTKADELMTVTEGTVSFAPKDYTFKLGMTYFLVETKAPNGYQLMDGAVKIVFSKNDGTDERHPSDKHPFMATITFPGAKSSETVYSSAATGPEGSADYQVATVGLTVSDKAIPSLPATGSNGRTALAATGVAAVTLGAYALWSRRRAFDQ